MRHFVLFVIDLEMCRVEIAGIVRGPDGGWMKQIACNLTDAEDRFLNGVHYHLERNHQGLDNELIEKPDDVPNMEGVVECHERLGGVLKLHQRAA